MILDILLINVIVSLIWQTDFFDSVDEWVCSKIPFHHLPKPFFCSLCGCWWLSLLYVIVTGQLSLLAIALCIASASLTNLTTAIWGMLTNILFRVVETINWAVDYIKCK